MGNVSDHICDHFVFALPTGSVLGQNQSMSVWNGQDHHLMALPISNVLFSKW